MVRQLSSLLTLAGRRRLAGRHQLAYTVLYTLTLVRYYGLPIV